MTSGGSGDEFVVVHRFMIEELGLKGATLLVYARIYGFCETSNLDFYESKPKTAEFLGLSERTVFHSIRELTARGLIYEVGSHELGVGRSTKVYRIARAPSARTKSEAARKTCAKRQSPEPTYDDAHDAERNAPEGSPPENPSGGVPPHEGNSCGETLPHEDTSGGDAVPHEGTACRRLREVHPIRKSENKEFIGEDL